jgi:hypothetical protein
MVTHSRFGFQMKILSKIEFHFFQTGCFLSESAYSFLVVANNIALMPLLSAALNSSVAFGNHDILLLPGPFPPSTFP